MIDIANLRSKFQRRYGAEPRIFRAPGRINIIGEHTDHNQGLVLPAAIDLATCVACSPRRDRKIKVASLSLGTDFEFTLGDEPSPDVPAWVRYVQGVASILERTGRKLIGANMLIDSNVPIGAGLSSSAALEVSATASLAGLAGYDCGGIEIAQIGQKAEHEFAGVKSGIMDQFASVFGKTGHALFLDCRSMSFSAVPLGDASFILFNTCVKHNLADSEYNQRRAECEEAAKFFGKGSLRDVSAADLGTVATDKRGSAIFRRARHVVSENERVLAAVSAFEKQDLSEVGRLLAASHASLRDDFEVSCAELDLMTELAETHEAILGSRMMGGGFGGCTINLVRPGADIGFIEDVKKRYQELTGIEAQAYYCITSDGLGEIECAG